MNSRTFVCCLFVLTALLFSAASPVCAQQTATLPAETLDDKDGCVIPFQNYSVLEPQIVVQVSVNGKPPLPFILDTGATAALIVFPNTAKTLGLQPGAQTNDINVFGQSVSLPIAPAETVRLIGVGGQDVTFPIKQADIADDSLYSQPDPLTPKVNGIVGLGLLVPNLSGVRFDFEAKTITVFTKTDLRQIKSRATILPMIWDPASCSFSVRVEYEPKKSIDLLVDTGSTSTQLPVSAVPFLSPIGEISDVYMSTVAVYVTSDLLLPGFNFGDYRVANVIVGIFPEAPNYSLGLNILSRYVITMDFRDKQMIVQDPSRPVAREPVLGNVGCVIHKRNNDYVLEQVVKGSPAEMAGVRVGDKILAIDGTSLAGVSEVRTAMLMLGIAGTQATWLLEKADGSHKTVSFLRGSQFDQRKTATTGLILKRPVGATLTVLAVSKGCLGDKAGLVEGDQIIMMKGKKTAAMSLLQLFGVLSSNDLSMTVQHPGDKTTHTVHLSMPAH